MMYGQPTIEPMRPIDCRSADNPTPILWSGLAIANNLIT